MQRILPFILLLASLLISACSPARSEWTPAPAQGFTIRTIATVHGARELAFAPDGTLFAGTDGGAVYIVPHAEATAPGTSSVFARLGDAPAAGVSFANGALYVGTQHAIWKIAYRPGDVSAGSAPQKLASVRTGEPPGNSDGDVHSTTSVAVLGSHVYASVGSSCNQCVETDPTRATVGEVRNGRYAVIARRIRNAIALAIDPSTGALWASDAGQDELPPPHPYEFADPVTAHAAPIDYGWPFCYDDRKHKPGTSQDCSNVTIPRVVFPAYETPIGAVFYPAARAGSYWFPKRFSGGLFVTLHGSWHGPAQGLSGYMPPLVVFVPMRGDSPARAVDWSDPSRQWISFLGGFQDAGSKSRAGRPTGIAVGPQGDLFVAEGQSGAIYRIKPAMK